VEQQRHPRQAVKVMCSEFQRVRRGRLLASHLAACSTFGHTGGIELVLVLCADLKSKQGFVWMR